ncbi:LysR family transcriptional regulator [Sphingobium sp. BHU LFT2]|uniref:LysR family transcriptional regulator n=1 Tax=Sphingobium sp. BHU LFT2 TaxID=2807634 RepID=UPI001BEB878A|nr:LysR family transcriptional regulator [Sphingobium sp. BHU LFT2]MBT2245865.1 LysR family transcriptional regulator [Sphingobium sp. BHU LFT2]
MRFDLTDLRLFLAVVDAGSITHGAAEVGLSLPAASERLRDMEATGAVTLLNRGRRGIAPTEAGEMLAHHARTILHQMAQMRGDIGQYAKGLRASVRIFANTAAITEFLPERLGSWMATHPQIDVDLKERESGEIARSVGAGFAEIGVLSSAVETGSLTMRPFAVDRLVAVTSRDHPLIQNRQARFVDLLGDQFIGMAGGALQDHIEDQASRLGTKMKMRIRLRNFQGICQMAGAGAGVGIIPESAAKRCQRSTRIAITRLRDEWTMRHLSLCVRDESDLTPPAKALFDHLSDPAK